MEEEKHFFINSKGDIVEQCPPFGEKMTRTKAEEIAQDTRDLNEYFRGDPRNDGWMKWDPEADDES